MSLLWFITSCPIKSLADDLFIYPTKNQSAEQQDKDKWECRAWATKQTGFDPAARAIASTPPPHAKRQKAGCCGALLVVRRWARSAALSGGTPERELR